MNPLQKNLKRKFWQVVIGQMLFVFVFALVFGFFKGRTAFESAFLGGLALSLPSFFFLRRVCKSVLSSPHSIVFSFYMGEAIKLFVSGILLVIIIKIVSILVLPLLWGYIMALIVFWVLSAVVLTNVIEKR